jgi:hypothetical protein
MKFCNKSALLVFALSLVLAASPVAAIDKAELINGTHWTQWSTQDKLVYIRGLCNWADFITLAQAQRGKSSEFSMSKTLVNELKTKTLGQVVSSVDTFYRENPGKLSTSVIEVVLRRCTNICPPGGA